MNMMTTMEPPNALLYRPRRAERFKALVSLFERDEIEDAVDALISYLDAKQGDVDVEANGDEHDHTNGEDEDRGFDGGDHLSGPGCSISDPDFGVDDPSGHGSGDRTYAEWHTLSASTRRAGRIDGKPLDGFASQLDEDAEATGDERDVAWTEWDGRPAWFKGHQEQIGSPTATEDDEMEDDRCLAGDDMVRAGAVVQNTWDRVRPGEEIGDADDAEPRFVPASMDRPAAANEVRA